MVWRWGVAHTRRQLQLVALKNRECPRKCKKEFTWKIHDSRTRYNTSTTPLSSITMQPCSLSKEYTYDRWSGCDRGAVRAPNKSRDMHLSIKYFTRRNHEKYNSGLAPCVKSAFTVATVLIFCVAPSSSAAPATRASLKYAKSKPLILGMRSRARAEE